jgi:hypothetical protein
LTTWLALPDGSYERLKDGDALYCEETERQGSGKVVALCDDHKTCHWLGIYGDDELSKAFESGRMKGPAPES